MSYPQKAITTNLKTLLDDTGLFTEVKRNLGLDFSGYPGAVIGPYDNDTVFDSNYENTRPYIFQIWILQDYQQETYTAAMDKLMDTTDRVLELLDKEEDPQAERSLSQNLDAAYTLIKTESEPSQFRNSELDGMLAQQILVRCTVLVNIPNLS